MIYFDGRCPDCKGVLFRPGPKSGMAQNLECVGCGSRFNVGFCQFVMAQRIANDSVWREDLFRKVLQ